MLTLTEAGLQALEARAALPITLPGLSIPAKEDMAARWQHRPERSDTTQETLALFQQGLTPTEIAVKRELTERHMIIWLDSSTTASLNCIKWCPPTLKRRYSKLWQPLAAPLD